MSMKKYECNLLHILDFSKIGISNKQQTKIIIIR